MQARLWCDGKGLDHGAPPGDEWGKHSPTSSVTSADRDFAAARDRGDAAPPRGDGWHKASFRSASDGYGYVAEAPPRAASRYDNLGSEPPLAAAAGRYSDGPSMGGHYDLMPHRARDALYAPSSIDDLERIRLDNERMKAQMEEQVAAGVLGWTTRDHVVVGGDGQTCLCAAFTLLGGVVQSQKVSDLVKELEHLKQQRDTGFGGGLGGYGDAFANDLLAAVQGDVWGGAYALEPYGGAVGIARQPHPSYGGGDGVVGSARGLDHFGSPPTPPRARVQAPSMFAEESEFIQRGDGGSSRRQQPQPPRGRMDVDPSSTLRFVGMDRPLTAYPSFDSGQSPLLSSVPSDRDAASPVKTTPRANGSGVKSPVSAALPPLEHSAFVPSVARSSGNGRTPRPVSAVEQSLASSRMLVYVDEEVADVVTDTVNASAEGAGVQSVSEPDTDYDTDFDDTIASEK